jgi:hypothetical protein
MHVYFGHKMACACTLSKLFWIAFHPDKSFLFSMQQGALQTKTGLGAIPSKQLKTQL